MHSQLALSVGQYSDKGRKAINQDCHGFCLPKEPHLTLKGVALALADGISSSSVSQIASETAVKSFLEDYYCTTESWSVKKSAHQVLKATNSWLYALTHKSPYRYEKDKGYVCTFSSLIIKGTHAHLLHLGDARIYRVTQSKLEQLTQDHRHWLSQHESYLSRALGVDQQLEIDYQCLALNQGDTFVLLTDGIYEFVEDEFIIRAINEHATNLNQAAQTIAEQAFDSGSDDNLTAQIVRIDNLPNPDSYSIFQQLTTLPVPPLLEARKQFDGYQIVRELHASHRSHAYLATDMETDTHLVIKIPSLDLRDDPAYLERFLLEEWIARRINSPHVLKPCAQTRAKNFIYTTTEFIDGQTLSQWMIDNPKAELETVRRIIEQIAKGLQAFHRKEMLHQDLRPQNIMIDRTGTVKIIDFGSTQVAGLSEIAYPDDANTILGTAQYTAPEYFLGEGGSPASDLFSLAVIAYQMLTGQLPYGTQIAKARSRAAQNRLVYRSALDDEREIPVWVDATLKKALHPNPYKRYQELSEFTYDLRHPNQAFLHKTLPPLMEQNPLLFWKSLCLMLTLIILLLLMQH